jgi:hypothetical protein
MRKLATACVILLLAAAGTRAQEVDARAVARARDFLQTGARGKEVCGILQFGCTYNGHHYLKTLGIKDGDGNLIKGYFALVYEFKWNDDGWTRLAFLCDSRGNVYKTQVVDHNGVLNQPFALADLSIKLIGAILLEAFKGNMTEAERRQAEKLIDDANSKGILEMTLKLRQAVSK